jgi:hypothetical protein
MIEHSFFDFVPWWALLVTAAPILLAFLPIVRFFMSPGKGEAPPPQHILFLKRVQTVLAEHYPDLVASFGDTASKVVIWDKNGQKMLTLKLSKDHPTRLEFSPNTQTPQLKTRLDAAFNPKPKITRSF